jgi:hypothetical protein
MNGPDPRPAVPPTNLPTLLDVRDVARWRGISERGARLLMLRELPAFKLGRRLVVRAEDLERALAAKAASAALARDRTAVAARVLAGLPAVPRKRMG